MIRKEVGKGAIYLYIQIISSMISGYIFLIFLARITTTEIIGTFSLLVAISEIFANIAVIGLPESIQKFVGRSFLQHKQADAKVFVIISFILLSVGIIASCLVILFFKDWLSNSFGIGFGLIIVVDLMVTSYAIYTVLYYTVVASLKTKVLPIIIIISSIAKVILGLSLVLMGYGILGLTLGYTFFGQILASVLLAIFICKIFKSTKKVTKPAAITIRNASESLLVGGIVAWIPVLITTLGIDIGTLVLYSTYGSHQSGVYFIALAIANAINAIVYSIFTISLPVLSSMHDGRKRFVWQIIRISAIMTLPLSCSIIFYSSDIMHLIGSNYDKGSSSLQILLLSSFPIIVFTGVENLVFSYGQYRHTLTISLATSIPRAILYVTLVPIFGMTGVAISYTIGSVIGFIASIMVANRITMSIIWKPLALTFFLPLSLAFVFATFNVNYIIGIVTTITITYLLLMKLHVIEKTDGLFFTELMPNRISKPLIAVSNKLEKIIDWFYG
jgi:O-antigen/teichoic acid export membrane protein